MPARYTVSYISTCQSKASATPQLHQLASMFLVLANLSWTILPLLIPQLASAQTPSVLVPPADEPLELDLLDQDTPLAGRNIITARTISQTRITTPSLWWAEEQFDGFGGKLLTNWIAYPDEQRIDLVVSPQPWTLLDYLGRYRFVNQFGTVARDYNYNVRVFNQRGVRLATYTCDYSKTLPDCQITISDSLGQNSLPVPRQ